MSELNTSKVSNPREHRVIPKTPEQIAIHSNLLDYCAHVWEHPDLRISLPLVVSPAEKPVITSWLFEPLVMKHEGIEMYDLKVGIPLEDDSPQTVRGMRLRTSRMGVAPGYLVTAGTYDNHPDHAGVQHIRGARWLWAAIDDAWNQTLATRLNEPVTRTFVILNPLMESVPRLLQGFVKVVDKKDVWSRTYQPMKE